MKNFEILNFTPHDVNIVGENGAITTFAPVGEPIRLAQETVTVGEVNGIPITETQFGDPVGLPEPKDGVFLIVSRLILTACIDRNDLVVPNEIVRDETGRIVGCKSLARN